MTLSDAQWNEVLLENAEVDDPEDDPNDIFCLKGNEGKPSVSDWIGQGRDKRSYYLLLRLLLAEGLLK